MPLNHIDPSEKMFGLLMEKAEYDKAIKSIQALTNLPYSAIDAKVKSLVLNTPQDWRYWCKRIHAMAAIGNLNVEWFTV